MSLHICQPETRWIRRVQPCPTCQTKRRIVGMVQDWYDTVWTCCTCGERWADGDLLPRPFKPGWREQRAAEARRHWRHALSPASIAWGERFSS